MSEELQTMEIVNKYRGKRVDTGEWVYGSLLGNHRPLIIGTHLLVDSFTSKGKTIEPSASDIWEVIPETVGQYIGFNDDVGNELYMGDVCEIPNWEPALHGIVYDRGGFCLCSSVKYCYSDCKYLEKAAKVGNIHDNPKLRKEVGYPEIVIK